MNEPYVDMARRLAAAQFMTDADPHEDGFADDFDHAMNIARELYLHESSDRVVAGYIIDEAEIHIRLDIVGGAVVRTVADTSYP